MIFVVCKPALMQSRGRRETEPVHVGYRLTFGPRADLEPVNRFHEPGGHETTYSADEAIFPPHEEGLKPILGTNGATGQTTGFDHVDAHQPTLPRILPGTPA
jgi:hypothetical protein